MAFQLDSNIPLLARSADPVAAVQGGLSMGNSTKDFLLRKREDPIRTEILQGQRDRQELEFDIREEERADAQKKRMDAETDRQIKSTANGAQGLMTTLKGNDIEGSKKFLKRRIEDLTKRAQDGQPDPRKFQDTIEALNILESGDATQIQNLKNSANELIGIAESRGLLDTSGGKSETKFSAKTVVLDNGTVIQGDSSGGVTVKNSAGQTLTGQEAETAIEEGRQFEVNQQGKRSESRKRGTLTAEGELAPNVAKQKKLATDAAALSTEIFNRVDGIEQNISNMREGMALIDQGAATGPIDKWLPSFKASTVKLDNLKNRLGLDVIGSVTFGALSAGELKTAFDTAVPSNLGPEELKAWFGERIAVQEKLLNSLEEAGIFLAEKDATLPKLMGKRRADRKAAAAPEQNSFTSSSGISFTVE